MKKPLLLVLTLLIVASTFAQHIAASDGQYLKSKEDSLKTYAAIMATSSRPDARFTADSSFTKTFVRSLKTRNSFFYPFDSLTTISILYAPDSSFRIITWQLELDADIVFQHGAIQMKTADGSLKLFPLIDKSKVIDNIDDTIADNKNWIGAVYYKIIETKNNDHNYYTLLGYDEDNIRCNRKVIEVLTFNENNQPVFGGAYFAFEKTLAKNTPIARYVMEYKKDAAPKLNFDAGLNMIVVEHLESESGEPNKKWTLVPDGDYEGFKWINGKWAHIDKIFSQITPEGQAPVPNPLNDNNGNLLIDKLGKPATAPATQNPKKTN
jgi:hypothetical protein